MGETTRSYVMNLFFLVAFFLAGSAIYTGLTLQLAHVVPPASYQELQRQMLSSVVIGGHLIGGTANGVLLFIPFIKKQSRRFQMISILLWQLVGAAIISFGMILLIPRTLQLIYLIRKDVRRHKRSGRKKR